MITKSFSEWLEASRPLDEDGFADDPEHEPYVSVPGVIVKKWITQTQPYVADILLTFAVEVYMGETIGWATNEGVGRLSQTFIGGKTLITESEFLANVKPILLSL